LKGGYLPRKYHLRAGITRIQTPPLAVVISNDMRRGWLSLSSKVNQIAADQALQKDTLPLLQNALSDEHEKFAVWEASEEEMVPQRCASSLSSTKPKEVGVVITWSC